MTQFRETEGKQMKVLSTHILGGLTVQQKFLLS
jgi:hypothetical protein